MSISIQRDIDAIAQAIPAEYLLDPPDGGDVTLAEGVQRMAARIQQLEAANNLNAAQVIALRARIEQLEAALREIADSKTRTAMALRPIARAALGEKE